MTDDTEPTTPTTPDPAADDLAALRDALLRAYPRAVPELVGGGSVGEVLASVEAATAAWERVAQEVAASAPMPMAMAAAPAPPPVPAGSAPAAAVDPDRLPPGEKIRRGLLGRAR